jgi:hypothetical protein
MSTEAGKFSQESYDNNDEYAKSLFKNFIVEKRKHKIISDDVEDYKHDIITEKNGKTHYFELEMKRNYPFTDENDFPFSSVSFLSRKHRLHNINEFEYIIICYETNYAVGCHSSKIFKNEYVEDIIVDQYERKGHDQFYRVPKNECYFFKL